MSYFIDLNENSEVVGLYKSVNKNIPNTVVEVDEETYKKVSEENLNYYDTETKTFSKKDLRTLNELKTSKISSINTSCETTITSGFPSSALGSGYIYPSQRDDQLNLQGLIIDGSDDFFKCKVAADENAEWELKPHTIDQLIIVGKALKSHVKTNTARAYELKAQINAAATIEELDGINW
ncbi:hypothetical protein [Arcobacter sp. CECT 8985]|uniref:DUF4376 domain-containing protein n=1 Tax=Arcobacter sp. CECT 8985 TaxID=1935424 RepID=UPI00100A9345|nr:hypothetical protein [Arcobacter sp. CECT 8985]RXJ86954.1 hypothetical protein CRU93_06115 [Arcobacter sp. CECT 8985]